MCGLSLLNLGLFLCEGSILPKKELKAPPTTFEKLNIFTENKNMTCKYYPNEQFKKLNKDNQYKHLLYSNISYVPYHTDNLTNLLCDLDFKIKEIAITESRLTTKKTQKTLLKYQINV